MFPRLLAAGMVLGVCWLPMAAHDMWIEPTQFTPQPGEIVGLKLRVGQELLGDPIPRDASLIHEFVVVDSAGRRPTIGRDGSDPAGLARVGARGLTIAGYFSNPSIAEQEPAKFLQYLKDEGLDEIAAQVAGKPHAGKVREQFSRCAKALLLTGEASAAQQDQALRFPLELVAETNPYLGGAEAPVKLLWHGKPLEGALVVARNRMHPELKQSVRTDRAGRVRLKMSAGGLWMVKAVHMIEAPKGSGAEWSSYWASLTYQLPNREAIVSNNRGAK